MARLEFLVDRAAAIADAAECVKERANISTAERIDCVFERAKDTLRTAEPVVAESLLSIILEAYSISGDTLSPNYPDACRRLGTLRRVQQKYQESLRLFADALRSDECSYGQSDSVLIQDLIGIGIAHAELNDKTAAESTFLRAKSISLSVHGEWHPRTAQIYNNLGLLYAKMGKGELSNEFTLKALEIRERVSPGDSLAIARSLINVAGYYAYTAHDYGKAEELYRRALQYEEAKLGPLDPRTGVTLKNLALLYRFQGRLGETEALLPRILEINRRNYANMHSNAAETFEMMSECARSRGIVDSALALAEAAYEIRLRLVDLELQGSTESQIIFRATKIQEALGTYLSAFFDMTDPSTAEVERAANLILRSKGIVLQEAVRQARYRFAGKDARGRALSDSLDATRESLAEQFIRERLGFDTTRQVHQFVTDSLARLKQRLEIALRVSSAQQESPSVPRGRTWAQIQPQIQEGAAVVDYFSYRALERNNPYVRADRYAAVIATPNTIRILDLADRLSTDSTIAWMTGQVASLSTAGHYPNSSEYSEYMQHARSLAEMIWDPISEQLKERESIYLCTDGDLSIVPFAALPVGDSTFLVESAAIHYLSVPEDMAIDPNDSGKKGLLLVGNPDFGSSDASGDDCDSELSLAVGQSAISDNPRVSRCVAEIGRTLSKLPGSRWEVDSVSLRWTSASDEPMTTLLDRAASESCVKSLASKNRILHFATHGFFLAGGCGAHATEDSSQISDPAEESNPLLLSGLFLAGANAGHVGAQATVEDGVLTAEEVLTMSLDGVDAVVLSACESGSGTVIPGEVVYGLRRAFRLAGAKTIISSVWPVSDADAAVLIAGFYRQEDTNIPDRLRAAQLDRIRYLRESGLPPHPLLWGPMISEGSRSITFE